MIILEEVWKLVRGLGEWCPIIGALTGRGEVRAVRDAEYGCTAEGEIFPFSQRAAAGDINQQVESDIPLRMKFSSTNSKIADPES